MQIITTNDFTHSISQKSVVTIGNFDGVHKGHLEIFQRVCHYASIESADSIAITFDPHPLQILNPERSPSQITTLVQKQSLIAQADLDMLLVIPFTVDFSLYSSEKFLQDVLIACLGMTKIIIGHDYAFGKNREGNEQFLRRCASGLGFSVESLDPVGDGQLVFSSSAVRRLVSSGDLVSANHMLGRSYSISGKVVHGHERGRLIGFPTANISTENQLIPADGVYAVWVETSNEIYMGACSIGKNPTFASLEKTIEVFLFDFDGMLYGHEITVYFTGKIRELLRFSDPSALTTQIASDVVLAKSLLSAGLPTRLTA